MSEESVEIVRKANAAPNDGDLDAFLEALAPDAELRDLANAPDQSGVVKGRAAFREVWTLWTEAFDEFRADIDEYVDRGDVVICAVHWHGKGKGSGMVIDTHQFDVYEVRDGQVVRGTLGYRSKAEALEAALKARRLLARLASERAMPLRQLADVAAILAELETDPAPRGGGKMLISLVGGSGA
jgi:ketosteroid isomerase-like protein